VVDFAWGTLVGRLCMGDFGRSTLGGRLYMGDFIWTSYSTAYMLIKNEVKFSFSNNNLIFIIVTSPSLQPQFALDHT